VAQIALHLEVGVEPPGKAVALQLAAELSLQGGLGKIGDVRRHPRHGQALFRPRSRRRVGAARQSGSAMMAWRPTS